MTIKKMTKYSKEKPQTIESLFDKIAPQYDLANSLMSFNLHKKWNNALASFVLAAKEPSDYLDLCSGTGDIAFNTLKRVKKKCEAFLLDFSERMLEIAKLKEMELQFPDHSLHYLKADAQMIPLPSNSMDAITMAYGIRNIQNPSLSIQEAHRVLRSEGTFALLELTRPTNFFMKLGHKLYTKSLLPLIGKYTTSDKEAYNYLQTSIQSFIHPKDLEKLFQDAGFQNTAIHSLNGGIATIITGRKFNH